jgi:hypothetical protein
MTYNPSIIKKSEDNRLRYALGIKGNNPLVVLGLNPSTADEEKSDPTIESVMRFAGRKNDGFIMINLYPLRATKPVNLPEEFNPEYHSANLKMIDAVLSDYQEIDVLVAFGDQIANRSYLKDCLKDIVSIISKHKVNWYIIGNLTQCGNPRHPLFRNDELTSFEVEDYVKNLK